MDSFYICRSCSHSFDEIERLPLILRCGHSFCLKCLDSKVDKKCPECRSKYELSKLNPNNLIIKLLRTQKQDNDPDIHNINLTKKQIGEIFDNCYTTAQELKQIHLLIDGILYFFENQKKLIEIDYFEKIEQITNEKNEKLNSIIFLEKYYKEVESTLDKLRPDFKEIDSLINKSFDEFSDENIIFLSNFEEFNPVKLDFEDFLNESQKSFDNLFEGAIIFCRPRYEYAKNENESIETKNWKYSITFQYISENLDNGQIKYLNVSDFDKVLDIDQKTFKAEKSLEKGIRAETNFLKIFGKKSFQMDFKIHNTKRGRISLGCSIDREDHYTSLELDENKTKIKNGDIISIILDKENNSIIYKKDQKILNFSKNFDFKGLISFFVQLYDENDKISIEHQKN